MSSEIFQKRLLQALEGLVGVACIADDILIYGVGDTLEEATQDHDKNLTSLLERCKEKSIWLNKEKVALRVQQLDFMGHQLTAQGLKPDLSKVVAILKLETPNTKEDSMELLIILQNSSQNSQRDKGDYKSFDWRLKRTRPYKY